MASKKRGSFAAAVLLVSCVSARAGDHAVFSPDLTSPAPAPVAAPAAATGAPMAVPRARSRRGHERYARARERRLARAAAELSRSVDPAANVRHLTIGTVPAPLPPGRDDVGNAVATLEAPAPAPAADAQPAAPGPAAEAEGPREAAANTLAEMLAKRAFENGVPLPLARAVVRIESGGNARATNHGALGLMQIKWATARAVGFTGPALALLVADTNLRFGMKVLAQAYRDARGDICGALMRYQSGHMARHPSAANRAYCARARALMARD